MISSIPEINKMGGYYKGRITTIHGEIANVSKQIIQKHIENQGKEF